MTITLTRKLQADIGETMFLRPRNPHDHKQWNEILPWMTPLFCYEMDGKQWVRWAVPPNIAHKMGMPTTGCSCCGKTAVVEDAGDVTVDTAWIETDWFLTSNGYALPEVSTPTIEGENP